MRLKDKVAIVTTGMGKVNDRGELDFLHQARAQAATRQEGVR